MNISDQNDDVNYQTLHRLMSLYNAPDFVKKAAFNDIMADNTLPPRAYALPSHNKFRTDSAAATWVSLAFLMDKKAEIEKDLFDHAFQRLNDAAAFHGISKQAEALVSKIAANVPVKDESLTDDKFAIIFYNDQNQRERHLRLLNSLEVKTAAQFLNKFHDKFTYDQRREIAEKIMDKANQYGASLGGLDDYIEKQAGLGDCASQDAIELIMNRLPVIGRVDKPNEVQLGLLKMADTIRQEPKTLHNPGTLHKIATVIDTIDKTYGVQHSALLPRPEDVLFKINKKLAAQIRDEHVSTTTGNIYKKSDLSRLPAKDIEDMLGHDFMGRITTGLSIDPEKFAEELHTLPRGDATLVDKLMNENGIQPAAKEASHSPTKLAITDLQKLATFHRERSQQQTIKQASTANDLTNKGEVIASLAASIRRRI